MKGIIYNIQKYSIYDGPEIRTTVLKRMSFYLFLELLS